MILAQAKTSPVSGSKIKHITDQLTALPITLLQSHFHFDHNQNIAEFDHVAFPELPFLQQNVGSDSIYTYTPQGI